MEKKGRFVKVVFTPQKLSGNKVTNHQHESGNTHPPTTHPPDR